MMASCPFWGMRVPSLCSHGVSLATRSCFAGCLGSELTAVRRAESVPVWGCRRLSQEPRGVSSSSTVIKEPNLYGRKSLVCGFSAQLGGDRGKRRAYRVLHLL